MVLMIGKAGKNSLPLGEVRTIDKKIPIGNISPKGYLTI